MRRMDGSAGVWILGGYQSDFARNLTKEGRDFADLTARSSTARSPRPRSTPPTSAWSTSPTPSARCSPARATSARCRPPSATSLWDTPASRHEAACASGSVATLAAMADLRSGAYDTALVVGIELEKTVPGDTAAQHLGAAAWTGHEGADARYLWPSMFAQVADEYDRRYGLDDTHLRAIAQLNFANARRNPNAQTRGWTVPDPITDDDATNPLTEGRLRRFDCSQMTDGGAGLVLVNDDYLREHPDRAPDRPHRRLGPSHRRAGSAAETGPRCRRPLRDAACAGRGARRVAPRPGDARRRRRLRGARLLHAQRVPGHRPHRADRTRANRGRPSRTARSRSADGCRSTPAAG